MKQLVALFTSLAVLSSVAAIAGPPKGNKGKKDTKKPARIVDVKHCPIMGGEVSDKNDKGIVVANKYRVHFCCGGCPAEWNKLSDKEKLAKAEAAAKKDAEAAKKGDKGKS